MSTELSTKGDMTKEERLEATTYTIFRTGSDRQRHYQIDKCIMGVSIEKYWVQLKGREGFWCDCPGFRRQNFPKIEHKHVKIAMDFSQRGEPRDAEYRIHGTGAKTEIEVLT